MCSRFEVDIQGLVGETIYDLQNRGIEYCHLVVRIEKIVGHFEDAVVVDRVPLLAAAGNNSQEAH